MFDSYLNESIIERARKNKKIKIDFFNPRDFSKDKHKKVDDKAYGGGPGMVMQAEPILECINCVLKKINKRKGKKMIDVVIFSPSGKKFTNKRAKILCKKHSDIILICGRYEGVDARVGKVLRAQKIKVEEISIGDYILTGGELPAMVLIDAVSRQIPGVLGKIDSLEENRISSSEMYTRPEVFEYKGKKFKAPRVLLSGNHKKIENWKIKIKK